MKSTNPDLSFELRSDWLVGYLRADRIRTDTLTQLVQHWDDPDARDEAIAALGHLAAVMQGPRREGELDAAIEAIENATSMDTARIEIGPHTARRLFAELAHVAAKLWRFDPFGLRAPAQERRRTA